MQILFLSFFYFRLPFIFHDVSAENSSSRGAADRVRYLLCKFVQNLHKKFGFVAPRELGPSLVKHAVSDSSDGRNLTSTGLDFVFYSVGTQMLCALGLVETNVLSFQQGSMAFLF